MECFYDNLDEMLKMLKEDLTIGFIEQSYETCADIKSIYPEIDRIVVHVADLCKMIPDVADVKALEAGYKEKCE